MIVTGDNNSEKTVKGYQRGWEQEWVLKEAGYISGFPLRTRALTLTKFSNFSVYLNFFIFAMEIMSLSFFSPSFCILFLFFLLNHEIGSPQCLETDLCGA